MVSFPSDYKQICSGLDLQVVHLLVSPDWFSIKGSFWTPKQCYNEARGGGSVAKSTCGSLLRDTVPTGHELFRERVSAAPKWYSDSPRRYYEDHMVQPPALQTRWLILVSKTLDSTIKSLCIFGTCHINTLGLSFYICKMNSYFQAMWCYNSKENTKAQIS